MTNVLTTVQPYGHANLPLQPRFCSFEIVLVKLLLVKLFENGSVGQTEQNISARFTDIYADFLRTQTCMLMNQL